jgi:hypothetical protein
MSAFRFSVFPHAPDATSHPENAKTLVFALSLLPLRRSWQRGTSKLKESRMSNTSTFIWSMIRWIWIEMFGRWRWSGVE